MAGEWQARGAAQVTCGQRGGNSYRSVVGFHGKWLPSGAGCPERVPWPLSCGVGGVIEAEKGGGQKFLPRRSRIQRQMASFKGLGAQRTCPGLCPVAWGVL